MAHHYTRGFCQSDDQPIRFLQTHAPLEAGAEVVVEVDWPRRSDHMQQHTSQHLISSVARRQFGFSTESWRLTKFPEQCQIEMVRHAR